jgi:hypothetical protein
VLNAHEPWPALAVDRHWAMVAHNAVVPLLIGLRRRSCSGRWTPPEPASGDWRRASPTCADSAPTCSPPRPADSQRRRGAGSAARGAEPLGSPGRPGRADGGGSDIVVPLVFDSPLGRLSFISTTTVFGTPNDVLLSELALETFLPADAATQGALRRAG